MKKIILFGGSFDPIHNAHLELTKKAFDFLKADKCYFILSQTPRWKKPLTSGKQRLEMLKLALKAYPEFEISLIEYNSEVETYTYETVLKFGNFEENKYYYLIGSDQLNLLDKWYEIEKLSSLVQFIVFNREGYPINQENLKKYHCILLNNETIDISSSNIRSLKAINSPKKVLDYIAKNDLYYFNDLKKYISQKRLVHSKSVASLAYELALKNNVNPNDAYLAGLLHDIAKGISPKKSREMMEKHFPTLVNEVPPAVYHQFLGCLMAKRRFSITNPSILLAIEFHATGCGRMDKLGKIIYVADKLDPTRGWDSKKYITKCKRSIQRGFPKVLEANIEYLIESGTRYENNFTFSCIDRYLVEEIV